MRKVTVAVALLGATCASAIATNAHAWGDMGHKTVCEIAMAKVKPSTRAAIVKLIKADGQFESFADTCTWPDHPRKRAEEHFVNLSRDASALTDDCGVASKCVVTAIAKDFAVLSSSTATADQKAASLKFLGHWVGDVHQPLHVSFEDDRGGNNVKASGEMRQQPALCLEHLSRGGCSRHQRQRRSRTAPDFNYPGINPGLDAVGSQTMGERVL